MECIKANKALPIVCARNNDRRVGYCTLRSHVDDAGCCNVTFYDWKEHGQQIASFSQY